MDDETVQQLPFNLNELNRSWSDLLSQLVVDKLTLEKRIAILETDNAQLKAELVELQPLRATMSQEAAKIAAEGRASIRESQKAAPRRAA